MHSIIVLFDSVKGGVGKSTLLVQFAVALSQKKYNVAIMDCDPQKSVETWAIRRFTGNIYPSYFSLLEDDIEAIDLHKQDYDFILIDSAGADTETGRELLLLADIVISPLQPTQAALDTVPIHYQILEEVFLGNTRLNVFYLLNDCATHAKDQEKIEAKIQLNKFLNGKLANLIPHFIYSRKLLKTSYSNGGTCFDSGKNKSKDEIKKVIDIIFSDETE